MLIPVGDLNPTRRRPVLTWALLLGNAGVFVLVQPWGADACAQIAFFLHHAAIPAELVQGAPLSVEQLAGTPAAQCGLEPVPDKRVYLAVLSSLFLHAGWLHLLGNMLYLGIFGNNVEDRFGHLRYLLFYLTSGVAATAMFVAANPWNPMTLVGASGAIAGVLGAYLFLFPRAWVTVWIPLLIFVVTRMPAFLVLGLWFVVQLQQLQQPAMTGGGVAYLAHAGGFAFGLAATALLRARGKLHSRRGGPRRR
jgi:membrane associated rhomboid family serine protease